MDLQQMSREELIRHIKEMHHYMENVVVFWGGIDEYREVFARIAENADGEFTPEESENAGVILGTDGAFEDFIAMVRDSFERGGINYVISEKVSMIMQEVASRQVKH